MVVVGALTGAIAGGIIFGAQGALSTLGAFAGALGAFLFWVVVIVVITALILKWLGIGESRTKYIEFTCLPWQPPNGGSDCEKCGSNGLPCSKYKCQSLGKTCEFINEGTDDELCINVAPDDSIAPIISPNENAIGDNLKYTEVKNNGFGIESTELNDGCIKEYSPIKFGLSLNEPAQCKVDTIHTNSYEEMLDFFGESNLYKTEKNTIIAAPTLSSLGVPGVGPGRKGDYNLFVRCKDTSGNSNIQEYVINLCVVPADDVSPPVINKFIPESSGFAGFNATEKFVQFYTNEPAECKWDILDREYDSMENNVLCRNEIVDVTANGWSCTTNLQVFNENEKDYYFRCKDQPWLSADDDNANDAKRNVNTQSTIYKLKKSIEELKISFISPNDETITSGLEPVSVKLEIHTEGGVNGNALCGFAFTNNGNFIDFFETGGNVHKQTFSTLFKGDYDINLMCKDAAENLAKGNSRFNIKIDKDGPLITRAYEQPLGTLRVITNENSECAFDFNNCNFNFKNGSLMSGTDFKHTTDLEKGKTYHAKCRDNFDNIGTCLAIKGGY